MARAETLVYDGIGGFNLRPNETGAYFWDVPEYPGNALCTWTVTAVPAGKLDGSADPEQRVEVINFFLLRKGPDSAGTGPNMLQLNWNVRNIGKNPATGRIIISAVVAMP